MSKKGFVIAVMICLLSSTAVAQDAPKKSKTEYENLLESSDAFVRTVDHFLLSIATSSNSWDLITRIRSVQLNNGETKHYLRFEAYDNSLYKNKTVAFYLNNATYSASITYDEVVAMNVALQQLSQSAEKDVESNLYISNAYSPTSSAIRVGYFVSAHRTNWYVQFDNFLKNPYIIINDKSELLKVFSEAQKDMEKYMAE